MSGPPPKAPKTEASAAPTTATIAAGASSVPSTPRPISAPGNPVRYLTDEQKAALNAKYGTLKQPTASDMAAVAQQGASCKMQ